MTLFEDALSFFPVGFVLDCNVDAAGHRVVTIMGANPGGQCDLVRPGQSPHLVFVDPEAPAFVRRHSGAIGQNGLYHRRLSGGIPENPEAIKFSFLCLPGEVVGAVSCPCQLRFTTYNILPFVMDPILEREDRESGDQKDIDSFESMPIEAGTWYPIELECSSGGQRALGVFVLDVPANTAGNTGTLAFVFGNDWEQDNRSAHLSRFGRRIGSVEWFSEPAPARAL